MSGSSAAPPGLTVSANGVGVVPDVLLNTFVQGGALVADVRNFVGLSKMTVQIVGTATAGDGGAGAFYYDPTATATDDNGVTCIQPYGMVYGRWLRIPQQSSQPGVWTNTQMNTPYTFLLGGLVPADFYHVSHPLPDNATIGLVAGVAVPAGSTVYEADAIAGYASTLSTATPAVGGSFYAYNLANGTVSYGINPLVSDQGFLSTVVGAEFDIGASNTGSSAYGINLISVFPNGTPSIAAAFQASALNAPWGFAFVCPDGSGNNALLCGALTTSANSDGQPIQLNARDSTNTVRICGIQAQHTSAGANLLLNTPTGGVVANGTLTATGVAAFNDAMTVGANAGALATFNSGLTTVGSITTNGSTTTYNTTSDATLKIDDGLVSAEQAMAVIKKLRPRWFRWKSDPGGASQPGFFAQQVHRVFPWAVTKGVRRKRPWQMDSATLMPVVVAALQALTAENADLRRRVAILEKRS